MLQYLRSPIEILGDGEKVTGIRVAVNEIVDDENGNLRAVATGETEDIECGLVMRSIGYRGEPVDDVPFEPKRGLIRNEGGRVTDEDGVPLARRVRRRLDQAWPVRRHRHEQEGRADTVAQDRRGRRDASTRRRSPTATRSPSGSPSAPRTSHLGRLGGDRRARARARASRTAARASSSCAWPT